MSHSVPASMAAPNPGITFSYEEGLSYVQHHLNSFMHGELKPWAHERHLNYSMVVNLKNGRLTRPMPHLVQQIIVSMGFDLKAKRIKKDNQFEVEFSLLDASQIALFRARMLT
ncbi:hypothetical protein [Hymenobacter norwichensis]|uniref:hypothetical protein n=1 Tax=Hymenobacter norwichensis TaxID=223903 RepID=UPI0012F98C22|nr:hypothetical protein [Hymenobacter norwichensis]